MFNQSREKKGGMYMIEQIVRSIKCLLIKIHVKKKKKKKKR
jgi:hypothetical protein